MAYAQDPEFDVLIQRKGAAARELFENPTLYREARLNGMPCSSDDSGRGFGQSASMCRMIFPSTR